MKGSGLGIFDVVFLLGIVQGFFLVLILALAPGRKRASNIFLALLILSFTLTHIQNWIYQMDFSQNPLVNRLYLYSFFLYGPSLFCYVYSLLYPDRNVGKERWYLFLPAILEVLVYMGIWLMSSLVSYDFATEGQIKEFVLILEYLAIPVNLFFLFWVFYELRTYKRESSEKDLRRRKSLLRSLKQLNIMILLVWAGWVLISPIDAYLFSGNLQIDVRNTFWLVISLAIYGIGYLGYIQPEFFFGHEKKSRSSSKDLDPEKMETEMQQLRALLEAQKLYQNPKLGLKDLAAAMGMLPGYLSRLINEQTGENFYDLINEYRIEEVKQNLLNETHQSFTILAIAYESGFNSKSTFNDIFKKTVGMTPSQFRRNRLENSSESMVSDE